MAAFLPAEMHRLTIAGTLDQLHQTLEECGRLKCVHIVDHDSEDESVRLGTPHADADALASTLTRMRAAVSRLNPNPAPGPVSVADAKKAISKDFASKVDSILEKCNLLDDAESELAALSEEESVLEIIAPLGLDLELLSDYDSITSFVGTIDAKAEVRLSNSTMIIRSGSSVAAFVRNEDSSEVQSALIAAGFKALQVPEGEGIPAKRMKEIQGRTNELGKRIVSLQSDLDAWCSDNGRMLLGVCEEMEREFEILQSPVRVATTNHAFMVDAWVPSDAADHVKKKLSKKATYVDTSAFVPSHGHHHDDDHHEETPPILLDNPDGAKPYELLTDLVGRPNYGRVDPTTFMMITYPIFFGMMLGDMGYGFMTLALAWWVNKNFGHSSEGALAARLLKYIGFSCVAFGFLYAEIWGFEIDATGDHAPPAWIGWMTIFYEWANHPHVELPFAINLAFPFHRVGGNMVDLIVISIYVGVAHLSLGFLIGFRDVTKAHGIAAGFFEKGSWLLLLLGGTAAIYAFVAGTKTSDSSHLATLDSMILYGGVVGLVGLVCVCWGLVKYEGFGGTGWMIGPLESISLLSNTLSYVRLFAIGVVGVKIAEAGNKLGYHNMVHGIDALIAGNDPILNVFIILGSLLLWLGVQVFAWVLGVFSPNIHTARLHFVEWMGKFYDGSGEPFAPLAGQNRFTSEAL